MMSGATPGPSRLQLPSLAGPSISRPSTSATVSYRRDIRPDRANRVNVSTSRASNRTVFQRTSQHSSLVRVTTSSYNTGTLTPSGRRSRAASSVGGGEGHQIIGAVSESRGIVPTVGIAFINFSTGEAVLSEICDNQSFVKTINKVTIFKPSKILIISTASPPHLRSSLYSTIEEEVPDVPIVPLDRKYWSGNTGSEFIQALAFKEDIEGIKVAIDRKYYALASFCAAMRYLELECGLRVAGHSLRIKYQPSEESMMISVPTIQALELIQNIQNPSSKGCLYGFLNETITPMGARMLRSNILQPSTQVQGILVRRYDALEELCTKEDMFFEVRKALKGFGDVEKLLTKLVVLPAEPSLEATQQAINNVLMIKSFVVSVPGLFESLAAARCDLLVEVRSHCRPQITSPILEQIAEVINDDVTSASKPLDLRNQRVYAIKSGIHGLLDVARTTFKEANDDVIQHVETLHEELSLDVQLKYDSKRRYWLRLRCSDLENGLIPPQLIHCVRKREFLECQTLQMVKLNQRITDSEDEAMMQSDKVVQYLLDTVRVAIPQLFQVCESIALLDMLASFGQTVTTRDYVKPEFKDALALKSARHPILEAVSLERGKRRGDHNSQLSDKARQSMDKFIPNDYYASRQHAFQIITGCNMSGKSTYIRTVALLQVMAQIGCFVPAQYASFSIVSNLFSRTTTDDSIESNLSTFSVEMRDMAFILRNIDNKSLVIIDELGRGTSTRDGLAIAIAMAEALVQSNAMVLFATHFTELAHVLEDRPGVLNLHLATRTNVAEDDVPKITMLYTVNSGPVREQNYGINLARAIGFPRRFLSLAENVSKSLQQNAEAKKQGCESRKLARRRKLILNLRETLQQAHDSDMDGDTLRSYLQRLQREFISRMEKIQSGRVDMVVDDEDSQDSQDESRGSARDMPPGSPIVVSDGSSVDSESLSTLDDAED